MSSSIYLRHFSAISKNKIADIVFHFSCKDNQTSEIACSKKLCANGIFLTKDIYK